MRREVGPTENKLFYFLIYKDMMRLTFILFFILFNLFVTTSNAQVGYTIKLNNSNSDYQQVKYIQDKLYQIFDTMPQYNNTLNIFIVKSTSVNINLQDFSQKMIEFGYTVVTFNKNLIEKKDDEETN